jgi:hypothetical protein
MSKFSIFFIISCFVLSITANCKNGKPTKIKEFSINLDLEPSLRLNKFYFYFNYFNYYFHRFKEIATFFKDGIVQVVNAQK